MSNESGGAYKIIGSTVVAIVSIVATIVGVGWWFGDAASRMKVLEWRLGKIEEVVKDTNSQSAVSALEVYDLKARVKYLEDRRK